MFKISILILSIFCLSACSVYKSQGRKQFESDSGERFSALSFKGCQSQSSLTTWWQSEFPARTYELTYNDTNCEAWQAHLEDGRVEIKTLQYKEDASDSTACTYEFSDESSWLASRDRFLQDLRNDTLTAD